MEKIKIEDISVVFMGKTTTIKNIVKFWKNVEKCKDLDQIGAIVYIARIIKEMSFDCKSLDEIMIYASENTNELKFIAMKVVIGLKLKEVNSGFVLLLAEKDIDAQYDLLLSFVSSTLSNK